MNAENGLVMNFPKLSLEGRNCAAAFVLLFVFLILIYANSFDCSWHYDDAPNIVDNTSIRMKNFSWAEMERSFHSYPEIEKRLYGKVISGPASSRPFAYFSFAVNYYFGGVNVFGYHAVNFAVHYLSAVFLFLFIYNLLQLPLLAPRYGQYAYSAALLSALLWAIHPIQVTAVTYIVQRMASMVSMFYIMAMYLYLKGRIAPTTSRAITLYILCFVSFVLAAGTKQNAAMLPVSLVLFDLYFIQGVDRKSLFRTAKLLLAIMICALGILFLIVGNDPSVVDYKIRTYGMTERLLTQPRIFFYYISLLLYPLNSRLMLVHDFDASRALFDPWTSFLSIGGLVILLGFALWKARRLPLISFAIIFFFINHLIEGSFFALELVYEHRNYLPSMLVFLPIAIGLLNLLDYYEKRKVVLVTFIGAISSVMVIWGVTVIMYNDVFKTEMTLWKDSAQKTPGLHSSHHNLGIAYLNAGQLPEAYNELQKALQSERLANITNKYRVYSTLVNYYIAINDEDKILASTNEALKIFPKRADLHNLKGMILLKRNDPAAAEVEIRQAIALRPNDARFHTTLGVTLLRKKDYRGAIDQAKSALHLDTDFWQAYVLISDTFKEKGNLPAAGHFHEVGLRLQGEQLRMPSKTDQL
jgi:protein O-mannosyl-transferase